MSRSALYRNGRAELREDLMSSTMSLLRLSYLCAVHVKMSSELLNMLDRGPGKIFRLQIQI